MFPLAVQDLRTESGITNKMPDSIENTDESAAEIICIQQSLGKFGLSLDIGLYCRQH